MKISELIDLVDSYKPNRFSDDTKVLWLNEVEGIIQTDIFLLSVEDVLEHKLSGTMSKTGVSFPDSKTMVLAEACSFPAGGLLTITGLTDETDEDEDTTKSWSSNNISAQQVLKRSPDGKTFTFAANTFAYVNTEDVCEQTLSMSYNGTNAELLVPAPWHKLYASWLEAMIDYHNQEYERYQNTLIKANEDLDEFRQWWALYVDPAGGGAVDTGYYLSAYALAKKKWLCRD